MPLTQRLRFILLRHDLNHQSQPWRSCRPKERRWGAPHRYCPRIAPAGPQSRAPGRDRSRRQHGPLRPAMRPSIPFGFRRIWPDNSPTTPIESMCRQALVVETALSSYLSPDNSERIEAALGRRLDRLTRRVERLERHITISNEALALYAANAAVAALFPQRGDPLPAR
jgi:hypothetical protein